MRKSNCTCLSVETSRQYWQIHRTLFSSALWRWVHIRYHLPRVSCCGSGKIFAVAQCRYMRFTVWPDENALKWMLGFTDLTGMELHWRQSLTILKLYFILCPGSNYHTATHYSHWRQMRNVGRLVKSTFRYFEAPLLFFARKATVLGTYTIYTQPNKEEMLEYPLLSRQQLQLHQNIVYFGSLFKSFIQELAKRVVEMHQCTVGPLGSAYIYERNDFLTCSNTANWPV